MKLIIGGSFQGKTAYAMERFPQITWIDGRTCAPEAIETAAGIHHFHEYIRRMIADGRQTSGFGRMLAEKNPELIVVTNELGYGVVPIDAFDRTYREATGRICTELASAADEVVRVVCGIGQVIKG